MMQTFRFATRLLVPAILMSALGCGDDSQEPLVATTMTANSPTALSGVVATAVAPLPSVLVKDQNDNPLGGVAVTFTVTGGGGSVTGGSATTNSSGIATVGSWTMGTAAGPNTVTATSNNLTTVTFTATGLAGAAATIQKTAGDAQNALPNGIVLIDPSVTVHDAHGNPVAGATVTFAVATGGGAVTGNTPATNAVGVATVGEWRLGAGGQNTLTASTPGAAPVTFQANVCLESHTFGMTTNGQLGPGDCRLASGEFIDAYSVTLPAADAFLFTQTSLDVDSYLLLGTLESPLAENDDYTTGQNAQIKAILPAGNYLLLPTTFDAGDVGSYALTSATTTAGVTNCAEVFVAPGISTAQSLQSTDCVFPTRPGVFDDDFIMVLLAGETVTIDMSSTAVDAFLELYGLGQRVAFNDDRDGTTNNARIVYTSPVNAYFIIAAGSLSAGETGAYTLTIQSSSPIGAARSVVLPSARHGDLKALSTARKRGVGGR